MMGARAAGSRAEAHRDALAAIYRCGAAYAERLPMLPTALERVAAVCTDELKTLSAARPKVTYLGLESGRASELFSAARKEWLPGLLHAPAWDAHVLVCVNHDLIYTYVDVALGGDGSQQPVIEPRPLSRIETRIAQTFVARLAAALKIAFEPFAATHFAPDGDIGGANPDRLGGPHAPVAIARYRLEAGRCSGELQLAIPDAVLTALKPAFARPPLGRTGTADPGWTQKIRGEINRTQLMMRAVLEDRPRTLAEVASLRVGQILALEATPRSPIRIDCNGEPLLWGEMGQSNGVYTLRVQGFVDREQEFMDGILSG